MKAQSPIYFTFLALAACATNKQEVLSDEERILRFKNEFPGYELCLCNEPDLSNNLVTSRMYWQMKEKPICGNPKENTIRIIYSQARKETQLYRLSKRDSTYYLTHKYLEWKDKLDKKGGFTLHEAEVKLPSPEADSIFRAIDSFKSIDHSNIVVLDGSSWRIEAMVNGTYSWFWIYGDRTETDRDFKRFLLEIFSSAVVPR